MEITGKEIKNLEALLKNKSAVRNLHTTDVAKILKNIHSRYEEKFAEQIDALPDELLGKVLMELPEKTRAQILAQTHAEKLKNALEAMDTDDAVDLLQHIEDVDEDKAKLILNKMSKADRDEIKKLKEYDDSVAGAIMQTELFDVWLDESIQDALNRYKKLKQDGELTNIHLVHVIDRSEKFIASMGLEDILLYDFSYTFSQLIQEGIARDFWVRDDEPIDKVVKYFQDYDISACAVVDSDGILLGRITNDDILDVVEDSATKQIYGLANVGHGGGLDEASSSLWRMRAIWLVVNLCTMLLASTVIGAFEETLGKYVALAILMPIIPALAGNAGMQALTVTVRQIALGHLEMKDAKKNLLSEMRIAIMNAGFFSIVTGLIAYVWFGDPRLGLTMGLAVTVTLLTSGFLGASVPIALKKLGVDPAVGSSVVVTGSLDILAFFSLFGIATLILF